MYVVIVPSSIPICSLFISNQVMGTSTKFLSKAIALNKA